MAGLLCYARVEMSVPEAAANSTLRNSMPMLNRRDVSVPCSRQLATRPTLRQSACCTRCNRLMLFNDAGDVGASVPLSSLT